MSVTALWYYFRVEDAGWSHQINLHVITSRIMDANVRVRVYLVWRLLHSACCNPSVSMRTRRPSVGPFRVCVCLNPSTLPMCSPHCFRRLHYLHERTKRRNVSRTRDTCSRCVSTRPYPGNGLHDVPLPIGYGGGTGHQDCTEPGGSPSPTTTSTVTSHLSTRPSYLWTRNALAHCSMSTAGRAFNLQ